MIHVYIFQNVDELNRTLNQSIAQMEDLEAQANKARRKTEDPDKLMEQLQLIQKKQKELMQMQLDLQVWTNALFDLICTFW